MALSHAPSTTKARREAFARILYAIGLGANNMQASEYAGRANNALSVWLNRGRGALANPELSRTGNMEECAEFVTEFERIRAETPTDKVKFAAMLEKKREQRLAALRGAGRAPTYDPRSVLTPDTQTKIIKCLKLGMTRLHSAQAAGIGSTTAIAWFERGSMALRILQNEGKDAVDESEYMYMVFAANVLVAEGEALGDWMQTLDNHARKDWRAHAFKIERRFPSSYGKHVSEQHIKSTSTNVHLVITSDEIAQARQDALAWETETFDEDE